MGKATLRGPVPKDDPMFSGGFEMFSRPRSRLEEKKREAESAHLNQTTSVSEKPGADSVGSSEEVASTQRQSDEKLK